MTTSWIDNLDTICTSSECTEDTCPKWHPDTDIPIERYGFWFKGEKRDSDITATRFADLMVEVAALETETGEALIRDLGTRVQADAAEFAGWWNAAVAA